MIREVSLSDSNQINELSRSLGYTEISNDCALDRLQLMLNSNNDKVWVFEKHSKIIGWVHAFRAFRIASAAFIEIGGMVVDPRHRRKAVGSKLVKQVKCWATENKLVLRVRCNVERESAHHFYAALEFSKIKSQHVFEYSFPR